MESYRKKGLNGGACESRAFREALDPLGNLASPTVSSSSLQELEIFHSAANRILPVLRKPRLSGVEFGFNAPVDYDRWQASFWASYRPEAGMNKASPDQAFVYADANGDEEVSQEEFSSIFFSCSPENADKPPGGAAAHAEKVEEAASTSHPKTNGSAAGAHTGTRIRTARCLYEGVEYEGKEVGPSSTQGNLTLCQARCLATPGCAHFTFRHVDGKCQMLDMEAGWRETSGAISGPVTRLFFQRQFFSEVSHCKKQGSSLGRGHRNR